MTNSKTAAKPICADYVDSVVAAVEPAHRSYLLCHHSWNCPKAPKLKGFPLKYAKHHFLELMSCRSHLDTLSAPLLARDGAAR
jgi:hypothetical protein